MISEEEFVDFLFSLAWSPWSAYHGDQVKSFIGEHFPGIDADKVISDFDEIIESKPAQGSPK